MSTTYIGIGSKQKENKHEEVGIVVFTVII